MQFRMAAGLMDEQAWRQQPADEIHRHLRYFEIVELEKARRG
jgi:hypothetical protein